MATATLRKDQTELSIPWFDLVAKIIMPLAAVAVAVTATAAYVTYVLKS